MDTLLSTMKVYCEIIEAGQFNIAAKKLNLSKGSVSKQLARLETHLGSRLLNRTTRRLTPTEVGLLFYKQSKYILELVDEAEKTATSLSSEPRGILNITAPTSFGSRYLGSLLAAYQAQYPRVKVKLSLNDKQQDIVEHGYDLAIRIATLEDSSLIARRITTLNMVICASPAYLEKHGEPEIPADLKNHQCLLYSYSDTEKYWLLENLKGEEKNIQVSGPLHANNGDVLCDGMINGMGIALLPYFIIEQAVKEGSATIILPEWKSKPPELSLVYPSRIFLSAKVRCFIDMAVKHFEDLAL